METKIQNLQMASQALYQSIIIIYQQFRPYFKLVGALLMTYLAFKLGKYSVAQPIMKKVNHLSSLIAKKQKQKDSIPSQINKIKKYIKFLIITFLFTCVVLGLLTYLKQIEVPTISWMVITMISFAFFLYLAIKQKVYSEKLKTVGQKERKIRQNIKQLIQLFGKKVQNNLKANLCRQKILNHQKMPTNICSKKTCQQIRSNLQIRYSAIKNLAQAALTFEWCSICKKAHPFDQLLSFEVHEMILREDSSEEQEVQYRTNYLIDGCEKMIEWIKKASPCNCSKLYIQQIIQHKKVFNQIDKEASSKIKVLQKNRNSLFKENK